MGRRSACWIRRGRSRWCGSADTRPPRWRCSRMRRRCRRCSTPGCCRARRRCARWPIFMALPTSPPNWPRSSPSRRRERERRLAVAGTAEPWLVRQRDQAARPCRAADPLDAVSPVLSRSRPRWRGGAGGCSGVSRGWDAAAGGRACAAGALQRARRNAAGPADAAAGVRARHAGERGVRAGDGGGDTGGGRGDRGDFKKPAIIWSYRCSTTT